MYLTDWSPNYPDFGSRLLDYDTDSDSDYEFDHIVKDFQDKINKIISGDHPKQEHGPSVSIAAELETESDLEDEAANLALSRIIEQDEGETILILILFKCPNIYIILILQPIMLLI